MLGAYLQHPPVPPCMCSSIWLPIVRNGISAPRAEVKNGRRSFPGSNPHFHPLFCACPGIRNVCTLLVRSYNPYAKILVPMSPQPPSSLTVHLPVPPSSFYAGVQPGPRLSWARCRPPGFSAGWPLFARWGAAQRLFSCSEAKEGLLPTAGFRSARVGPWCLLGRCSAISFTQLGTKRSLLAPAASIMEHAGLQRALALHCDGMGLMQVAGLCCGDGG